MSADQTQHIQDALARGEHPAIRTLADIADVDRVIAVALQHRVGRLWLGSMPDLSSAIADRLLGYESDFRTSKRDATLRNIVHAASGAALVRHAPAIASGSAAPQLWQRLADGTHDIERSAVEIITSDDLHAAENTMYLLLLDPIDPYGIGDQTRVAIARSGLGSTAASIRTLAAEYLYDNEPDALADAWGELVFDEDERVRGLAWSTGFQSDPHAAFDRASEILSDEHRELQSRRSALAAIGTHLPTSEVVDILALLVVHPQEGLALDAGNLLYRLHRHPTIATAAVESPHQSVREIGAFLLDPYRGSPAAGGSRPGDPTRSDIFAELIRQTEDRALDDEPDSDAGSR
ncbi:MAG TPA: hypothetical protein VHG52_01980 [Thermomicrobiales bacterium]|nr:hypothetical protein [Thermomicrobiales bacterium]